MPLVNDEANLIKNYATQRAWLKLPFTPYNIRLIYLSFFSKNAGSKNMVQV